MASLERVHWESLSSGSVAAVLSVRVTSLMMNRVAWLVGGRSVELHVLLKDSEQAYKEVEGKRSNTNFIAQAMTFLWHLHTVFEVRIPMCFKFLFNWLKMWGEFASQEKLSLCISAKLSVPYVYSCNLLRFSYIDTWWFLNNLTTYTTGRHSAYSATIWTQMQTHTGTILKYTRV